MLQADANPPEQLQLQELENEELSSLNQILDLGEDSELFPETTRMSEVSSCSGCGITGSGSGSTDEGGGGDVSCYEDASFSSPFSSLSSMDPSTLVALLDAPDLEPPPLPISTMNCHPLPPLPSSSSDLATTCNMPAGLWGCLSNNNIRNDNHYFDIPIGVTDTTTTNGYAMQGCSSTDQLGLPHLSVGTSQIPHILPPVMPLPTPLVFENNGLVSSSVLQGVVGSTGLDLATSCSFVDPIGVATGIYCPTGGMGMPVGSLLGNSSSLGAEGTPVKISELTDHYQSDNYGGLSFYASVASETTSQQMAYNSTDVQVLPDEQHVTAGGCGSPARLPSEATSLEESTFKVGRLTVEERKEKIHRYLKKRNERNFSKKIKYACRKTLADSRPRVRGRFAKNDEFGEAACRPSSSNHDDDEDDEDVLIKDDDLLDSTDILAHLNTFKCSYTLESWI